MIIFYHVNLSTAYLFLGIMEISYAHINWYNFYSKIFNLGARRSGDVHFVIAGLNSKPFHSTYVEKAYSTVDCDSSAGWGH